MSSPVSEWQATPFLEPGSELPVYLQIAHALMRDIHAGRFSPGESLPGYRTVAERLGVSRNTVMAAYAELRAEGWIVSTPGEGSAVASLLPAHLPPGLEQSARVRAKPAMGFDLAGETPAAAVAPQRRLLEVASGVPDPRLLPGAALARNYRRALTQGRAYGAADPQGHPRLRAALAHLLSRGRGVPTTEAQVLVTRGTQMALVLVSQALFSPGEAVAVEAMGGRGAWDAFARAGARCLPVPVDEEGLQVDALEPLLRTERLRAVLVTPRRQYPTLAVLSPGRRARLLSLAQANRFAVLEIDQDSEMQLEGAPAAPLAAAAGAPGVVVHLGTLSKIFSPDLRLGFVHGPAPLVARLREVRAVLDRHGDPVLERAMAELMEDGELQRHLNRMIQIYRRRRNALCAALRRTLAEVVSVESPSGGLALWVPVRPGVDVDRWAARALERGVSFQPGRQFAFDGAPVQALRMGFANYPEPQLEEVARRMQAALEDAA